MQPIKGEIQRRSSVALWLIAAVAGSVAVLVGIAVAEHGPGISPDSTSYVGGARSLAGGSGYRTSTYPPLYSWLISLWLHAGLSATAAAVTINVLSYAGLVAIVGNWLLWATRSAGLAVLACVLVAVSPPLLFVSIYVWTETLFTFLIVASAYFLTRHLERGDVRPLLGATVLMLLAMFTRYAGLLFVVAYAALLVLHGHPNGHRRWREASLFAGFSLLPVGLWVASRSTPPFQWSRFGLADTFSFLASTFARWLFDDLVAPEAGMALAAFVLLLAAIPGCRGLYGWAMRRDGGAVPTTASFALAAASAYALGLCLWASLQAFDRIGDRLLAPIYPLLIVGGTAAFRRVWDGRRVSKAPIRERQTGTVGWGRAGRLFGAAMLLWLAVPAAGVWDIVMQSRSLGFGYAAVTWRRSELAAFLRGWNADGVLLSNHPAAAYWLTGRNYRWSPRLGFHNAASDLVPADLEALIQDLGRGVRIYLVWFDQPIPDRLMSLDQLAERLELEPIAVFADGKVMRIAGVL